MQFKDIAPLFGVLTITLTTAAPATRAAAWEALPAQPPIPADNPQTPEKVLLGKTLFFDPRLSQQGTLSCNSCHNLMAGGDDNRPNSVGINDARGKRSAPTVWNAAFLSVQFWDGRAATLEDQAKGPVANPVEMGMPSLDEAIARLKSIPGYLPMFQAAFPEDADPIDGDNTAKAIAAFERTLITPNSAFDRYVAGDKDAMSEQQVRGMNAFSELGCASCHAGPNFSGPALPAGAGFFQRFPAYEDSDFEQRYDLVADHGRFVVTGKESDKHMWRVPTLRNIALTAPYFHNGGVPTLEEAVRVMAKTQLNKELTPAQTRDLVAFLNALTGEFPELSLPRLPATPNMSLVDAGRPDRAEDSQP